MENVTIYKKATGIIDRRLVLPSEQLMLNVAEDETYLLDCPIEATQVVNGVPITVVEDVSFEQAKRKLEAEIQHYIDEIARTNGNWDTMLSARASAALPGPFQAQAVSLAEWWSDVWNYCYQVLGEVEAGLRTIPTTEEMLSELPPYNKLSI